MSNPKSVILVIEDDAQIRRVLIASLEAYGYEIHTAETGQHGVQLAERHRPDLVILDLGLPDVARTTEDVKVRALDLGADDYLTKPFGLYELLARVRVALRRAHRNDKAEPCIELPSVGVRIDLARRMVWRDGKEVHLTPTEFRLIATLVKHGGKILTHEQLLADVWGEGHEKDTQYLRIYLGGLRKKLEPDPSQPKVLLTVPGVGYQLVLDAAGPAG
jgi:two-component system KDP operon response regulator KdpE